ncbi:MAG TPA: hypothetical protein VFU82_09240 [Gammaproteobacteria bacterium]|jgi:hypothetical protein|nr:hypothetical protein [Gammaproteobacteria bacterium]
MPKEPPLSADRLLFNLEDKAFFEGLECVGPDQNQGMFKRSIGFHNNNPPCATRHQELEGLLNNGALPDEVKPPLKQVMQSSIQVGVCQFWQSNHDPRAQGGDCQAAEAVLNEARDEFRRRYRY